ncbi:hypothetical protein [Cnuibacter physcomitrellae]|uniref:hypothetical protein n=1 Tax=Cnuibacter physcomitrellae TaxID=1619308 RepID=UPI00166758E5|nr:hypothetical protein [Cnuibacter physcomitrellae]
MSETITTATGTAPITRIEPAVEQTAKGGTWEVVVLGSACAITVLAALASFCTLGVQ